MLAIAIKVLIIGLLLFVVYNLFRALFVMLKNDPNGPSMSEFIGKRLKFTALAVIIILLAIMFGVIEPNPRPF